MEKSDNSSSDKTKILFANGRMSHPFIVGGDGPITHTLARELHRRRHPVENFGALYPKNFPKKDREIFEHLDQLGIDYSVFTDQYTANRGDTIIPVNKRVVYESPYRNTMVEMSYFLEELDRKVDETKPDAVITQLEYSPEIIDYCYEKGLPVILYILDNEPENQFALDRQERISYILFVSSYTQGKYESRIAKPSSVLHPLFEFDDYQVSENSKRYITMINPVPAKGVEIFLELARYFHNREFLAVEGWHAPDIDFSKYPNITLMPKQDDMRGIFSQTRVLIVPSQWEEGFGRVNVEALINGIPVVASARGGIPEAVGNGGLLVHGYNDPNEWFNKVSQLELNPDLYKQLSAQGKIHARRFEARSQIYQLLEIVEAIKKGEPLLQETRGEVDRQNEVNKWTESIFPPISISSTQEGNKMRIELGSGERPQGGYIHCDLRPAKNTDIICDATNLPFSDSSTDEIYTSHLIEHFEWHRTIEILKEWHRVLKPGGKLVLVCPNFRFMAEKFVADEYEKHGCYSIEADTFGFQDHPFNYHKTAFWYESLGEKLKKAGFSSVEDLSATNGLHDQQMELRIQAIK